MYHTGHRKPTTAEAAEIEEWPSSRDAWFIHPQAWRQKYYRDKARVQRSGGIGIANETGQEDRRLRGVAV
jgi:hypothetical protein